jgi:hypothetical protein
MKQYRSEAAVHETESMDLQIGKHPPLPGSKGREHYISRSHSKKKISKREEKKGGN